MEEISLGIQVFGKIKDYLNLNRIKRKYLLLQLSDGSIRCGLALNPFAFGGKACTLKDIVTEIEENVFWDHCISIKVFESKDTAIQALDKSRRSKDFEREIIVALTSSRHFYETCETIHKEYSSVSVLSKSPGLLLPTERNLTNFRKKYFKTILNRLSEGEGSYNLKYLFDERVFKLFLMKYKTEGKEELIEETRNMLETILKYKNLDLRCGDTEPLTGSVIGGGQIACIGFKEERTKAITEGVLIKAPEMVRIIVYQYNELFNKAKKVEKSILDSMLDDLQGEKK